MAGKYRITRRKQVVDSLVVRRDSPEEAFADGVGRSYIHTWTKEGDREYEYFIEPVFD